MAYGFIWRPLAALVFLLLFPCGPAAITRFVVSVNVNTVDCSVGEWAGSHVPQECSEVAPFFADLYPATSVILEHGAPTILTTTAHVDPCPVFAGLAAPGVAVRRVAVAIDSRDFTPQASATANAPVSKRATSHDACRAAVAATSPSDLAVLLNANAREHDETTDSDASQRDEGWHRPIVPDRWGDK